MKSEQIAHDYQIKASTKQDANQIFELVTKSIAHAPLGSIKLSTAHNSRSEIFFKNKMYSDCLMDMDRMKKNLLPRDLKSKMYLKSSKCHQILGAEALAKSRQCLKNDVDAEKQKLIEENLIKWETYISSSTKFKNYKWNGKDIAPKLETENSMIPGLSDSVKLMYSLEYGRHIIATKDIEPGELIGVQKPFAMTVKHELLYDYCWYCTKQLLCSSLPCYECVHVLYCSAACRNKAQREYHDIECFVMRQLFAFSTVGDNTLLALRLTIAALKEASNSIDILKTNLKKIDGIAG